MCNDVIRDTHFTASVVLYRRMHARTFGSLQSMAEQAQPDSRQCPYCVCCAVMTRLQPCPVPLTAWVHWRPAAKLACPLFALSPLAELVVAFTAMKGLANFVELFKQALLQLH